MKVLILAGGVGSRLSEETIVRAKPMVEIGEQPILWHILNIYSAYGLNEFVIALGYKGNTIKDYFVNYYTLTNDLSVELSTGQVRVHESSHSNWKVDLIDTGINTLTGGRLKRLKKWTEGQSFMLTYGDGVADINIMKLSEFHRAHGKLVTVTAVRPPSRFGSIQFNDDQIISFEEKPQSGEGWVNGGFFVMEQGVFDYLEGDLTSLEKGTLDALANDGQLMAYKHDGFFQPMDTLREKHLLEELWASGRAPWKVW